MNRDIVLCPGTKRSRPIVIKTETRTALDHRCKKASWKNPQGGRQVEITLPRINALKEKR
ncbi:MAG: hypothetical protein RIE06_22970 [Roseibium album]|uniref:hypothetical protein n=1 Tax=Roseibium album TaxID=311410 RepID=UPI0032F072DB